VKKGYRGWEEKSSFTFIHRLLFKNSVLAYLHIELDSSSVNSFPKIYTGQVCLLLLPSWAGLLSGIIDRRQ
jgi:hypothetical protein